MVRARLTRLLLASGLAALLIGPGRPSRAAEQASSGPWETFYASIPPLKPLPKDKAYVLRVLYLEDDRLPTLTAAQRKSLYGRIEVLLNDWYGYSVKVREVGSRSLTGWFLSDPEVFEKPAYADALKKMELDVDTPDGRKALLAAIQRDFEGRDLRQIRTYLGSSDLKDKPSAARAAARLFLDKLAEIRSIRLADGKRFYDKLTARLLSFPHWAVKILDVEDADFILTNSTLASADSGMPIYVIVRGGITTGMVDNNLHNPYQAVGMVGLFPFLSDAPFFLRERGILLDEDRLDVIATFWMHELGHFFLRYAEYYDHPHCVHVAPMGLGYVGWHQQIRKFGLCPLEHKTVEKY